MENQTTIKPQTKAQIAAEFEALKAALKAAQDENAAIKAQQSAGISFRVSDKGCVSIYGLGNGKWPTTLYPSALEKLVAESTVTRLRAFLAENLASGKLQMRKEFPAKGAVVNHTEPTTTQSARAAAVEAMIDAHDQESA